MKENKKKKKYMERVSINIKISYILEILKIILDKEKVKKLQIDIIIMDILIMIK